LTSSSHVRRKSKSKWRVCMWCVGRQKTSRGWTEPLLTFLTDLQCRSCPRLQTIVAPLLLFSCCSGAWCCEAECVVKQLCVMWKSCVCWRVLQSACLRNHLNESLVSQGECIHVHIVKDRSASANVCCVNVWSELSWLDARLTPKINSIVCKCGRNACVSEYVGMFVCGCVKVEMCVWIQVCVNTCGSVCLNSGVCEHLWKCVFKFRCAVCFVWYRTANWQKIQYWWTYILYDTVTVHQLHKCSATVCNLLRQIKSTPSVGFAVGKHSLIVTVLLKLHNIVTVLLKLHNIETKMSCEMFDGGQNEMTGWFPGHCGKWKTQALHSETKETTQKDVVGFLDWVRNATWLVELVELSFWCVQSSSLVYGKCASGQHITRSKVNAGTVWQLCYSVQRLTYAKSKVEMMRCTLFHKSEKLWNALSVIEK
jgi:hypothetical protein